MERKSQITFILLLIALVFVYVRPYEIVPFLEQLKIAKVALIAALVFSFIEGHKTGFVLKERSFWLFLMLEALTVALIPFSAWPSNSYDFWLNSYLKVFLVFYLFLIMASDFKKFDLLLKTIFVCCTVIAVRAVMAFFTGQVVFDADGTRRIAGVSMLSSNDPNDLALAFAMAVPVGLYYTFVNRGLKRYLFASMALLNVVAIVFTGSRGGYLGIICGAAVFFGFAYWKNKGRLAIAVLLAASAAAAFVPAEYKTRFMSSFDSNDYSYTDEKAGRVAIWKRGMRSAFEEPFGAGIKSYTIIEGERRREEGFTGRWTAAHNTYIQIAVELGIAGLALYLLFLWEGFRSLAQALGMTQSPELRFCAYALIASLASFTLSSMFLSQAYYWNQYIFVALAASLRNIVVKGRAADKAAEAA